LGSWAAFLVGSGFAVVAIGLLWFGSGREARE
jgi:hypothetical protein